MFAIFNPPAGAKYAKKSKAKAKGKYKKKKKARKTAYQSFVSKYFAAHPGATMAAAGAAWSKGEGKILKHKASRAAAHRGMGRQFIRRSEVPGIVSSAMRSNICNVTALQRARQKYCGTSAKTGLSSFLEKFKSASTLPGDRLRSAAELGYRAVANNSGRLSMKRGKKSRRGLFGLAPVKFNMGEIAAMNPPQAAGVLAGVQPHNISGAVPVMAGYILNHMVSKAVAGKIPMTKSGAGNYALGLATGGLLAAAANQFINKSVAKSVLLGAVIEPLVRAIDDVSSNGLSALTLKGAFEEGLNDTVTGQPLGDFTTPGQIGTAINTESSESQYSLPAATQQVNPQQQMQAYEDSVLAAVME